MVSEDKINRIRESVDIVSTIEEYFPLKRAGVNYKALCPFHQEKTPSFVVSPEKQIFHCFGCGESGNVFNFLMKMEGLDFIDSVKRLAARTGIQLDFEKDEKYEKKKKLRDMIIDLNRRAAVYYRKMLDGARGKKAAVYLKQRGLDPETIESFQLGYAPDDNSLVKQALKEGVSEDILVKSGLAGKGDDNRLFDKFRSRIMFPIFDENGQVAGFGGRIMEDSAKLAKYINTAQNEVFEKKKLIYGFYHAKNKIRDTKKVLLLEGYMDVIAAHQFGISNAVATLGTALTQDHIYKLRHWVEEVVLSFDADEAGSEATARGMEILLGSDVMGKVCELPSKKDPEDIIRKDSGEFIKCVNEAQPILDWRIGYSIKKFSHLDDRVFMQEKIIQDLNPVINIVSFDPIKRHEMARLLSHKMNLSQRGYMALEEKISKVLGKTSSGYRQELKMTSSVPQSGIPEKEEKLMKEMLHILLKKPELTVNVKDIVSIDLDSKNMYYNMLKDYIYTYNADTHRMMEDEKSKSVVSELACKPLNSTEPEVYLASLKEDYKRFGVKKEFEKVSAEINTMIKNNQPVDKEKKEIYDKLKKDLKGIKKKIKLGGSIG
ncbi:MAG: DNA primase [Elusimicrobia bacterium]|nr:DNA primase [Elusimicrobiota bacterium]